MTEPQRHLAAVEQDGRPHSRACGIRVHDHGPECHTNCPTCQGKQDSQPIPEVPMFEGKPVEATRLKVTTASTGLEIDAVLRMDDIIRVVVEARVSDIRHVVNEKTGDLVRHQAARVITANLIPWDASDPADKGVLRG